MALPGLSPLPTPHKEKHKDGDSGPHLPRQDGAEEAPHQADFLVEEGLLVGGGQVPVVVVVVGVHVWWCGERKGRGWATD